MGTMGILSLQGYPKVLSIGSKVLSIGSKVLSIEPMLSTLESMLSTLGPMPNLEQQRDLSPRARMLFGGSKVMSIGSP